MENVTNFIADYYPQIFGLTLLVYLISGVVVVRENHAVVVELFGKFWKVFEPGLNWRPSLFSKIAHNVFTGTFPYDLDLGGEGLGGDAVEFKDESANVFVIIQFVIVDPKLAAYAAKDPPSFIRMVQDLFDSVVRGFLGGFKVMEADKLKNTFTLDVIAQGVRLKKTQTPKAIKDTLFGQKLAQWGVVPTLISIQDIGLPERIMAQMRRTMQVAKDLEIAEAEIKVAEAEAAKALVVAENSKQIEVISAEGRKKATEMMAEATALRIQKLIEQGVDPNQASQLVADLENVEALKRAGNVTWIGGNTDLAKLGAHIGAGMNK
ncbi:hypothetical protein CVU83_02055 [Candidatus Falkowbacteria bacterium HGW-Falkowbacteria-2]|uniref:Band 7 domain-containing protein n=1 Tax=Candidatus Falkowbacteria bacterium HGW-Falkowbacteria-2 TaxID=2013769 RepID=A0A2N2E0J6_9BACT|nr:MAG: hypothetical protein CVU83_02055 [Candidatus Falkowbacteria bacterium HGW-Falkowbacteria-2]